MGKLCGKKSGIEFSFTEEGREGGIEGERDIMYQLSLEYFVDICSSYVYDLNWGNKKHPRNTIKQHTLLVLQPQQFGKK